MKCHNIDAHLMKIKKVTCKSMKVEYSRIDDHDFIYIAYRSDTIINVVLFLHFFPGKQAQNVTSLQSYCDVFILCHGCPFSLKSTQLYLITALNPFHSHTQLVSCASHQYKSGLRNLGYNVTAITTYQTRTREYGFQIN